MRSDTSSFVDGCCFDLDMPVLHSRERHFVLLGRFCIFFFFLDIVHSGLLLFSGGHTATRCYRPGPFEIK